MDTDQKIMQTLKQHGHTYHDGHFWTPCPYCDKEIEIMYDDSGDDSYWGECSGCACNIDYFGKSA